MVDTLNFNGYHLAQLKGITKAGNSSTVDFYRISCDDDFPIMQKLKQLDFNKLIPSKTASHSFDNFARTTIDEALYDDRVAFMAVSDNKPCGLLVGDIQNKKGSINHFMAWPTSENGKIKNVGEGLLQVFLNTALAKDCKSVELSAMPLKYSNCVSFYERNGFESISPLSPHQGGISMILGDLGNVSKKKIQELGLKFSKNKENVDLNHLDLNF